MKYSILRQTLLSGALTTLFFAGECNAQVFPTAPELQWRGSCEPPNVVDNPLVVDLGANPGPGEEQATEESGEDWWYDVIPFDETGATTGYMASGFASWVNIDFDETLVGGLFEPNVGMPDVNRPIIEGEVLSTKLAAISRYNQHGKMIWMKSYCIAEEGAMSIISTNDGGFAFTGWGKATVNVNGDPLLYNPVGTTDDFDMTNPAFPIENRGSKMLVGKIDADGNLLWLNAYGFYDMSTTPSPTNIYDYNAMKTNCIGYDLAMMNDGNIRVVGHSEEAPGSNTQKVFMIDIDQNGMVVDKLHRKKLFGLSNYKTSAREIQPSLLGDDFFVAGLQLNKSGAGLGNLNKSDAILFKVDQSMNQVDFANDSWDGNPIDGLYNKAAVRYSEGDNNVGWDIKVLNDGKVAWAFIEKCNSCLNSGKNIGQGRIFLYGNELGTTLTRLIDINEVRAFDMKMGLIATSSGGFACVTTKKGNYLDPKETALQSLIKADLESQVNTGDLIDPDDISSFWNTDAYVAKFDDNGSLLWDKSWDAFDGPAEYYPGDYKEQECLYRILEDHDGGLVITGNNSCNKDDFYVAKVLSDCPQSVYYDRIPPNPNSNFFPINGTVEWNMTTVPSGLMRIRGEITVKPGATLIIDGITVEFADSRAMEEITTLIVRAGGHLIIKNGAKLTSLSTCGGNMWDGIEVWGNSSSPQTPGHQGWVTISGGSTIEHAREAVVLWHPDHWSQTGGVIEAENSFFLNNIRDVAFMSYQYGGAFIQPNKSTFKNVDFITDDSFKRNTPLNHVSLYRVHTVKFQGCHFKDSRSSVVSPLLLSGNVVNCGIRSIDAKYAVSAISPSNRSSFERLDFGIYASNTHTEKSISVIETDFTNNIYGIELVDANSPTVLLNNFNFNSALNDFTGTNQYGIHAIRTKEMRIEQNNFVNIDAPNPTLGIVCSDLGEGDQDIYKNVFKNLYIGNYAQGQNRSSTETTPVPGTNGLEFLCNENINNRYDHYIAGTLWNMHDEDEYGVSAINGAYSKPSENTFTANGNACEDINNESDHLMFYYHGIGSEPIETCNENDGDDDGAIFSSLSTNTNYCVSKIGEFPSGILPQHTISKLSGLFTNYSNLLNSQNQTYKGLINGGNTQNLLQAVSGMNNNNSSQIHQMLLSYSPYLTAEVIKAALNNSSNVYTHQQGYNLIVANIDVGRTKGFIKYLSTMQNPMPNAMIQSIETLINNGSTTDKFKREAELAETSGLRSFAADMLIRHYKNDVTANQSSIKYWIEQKNDVFVKERLIDFYLEQNDLNSASQEISNLQNSLQSYPANVQQELRNIIDYKTKLTQILSSPGKIANLSASDYQYIEDIATNGLGSVKYQAQELLCFFYGECADRSINIIPNSNSQNKSSVIEIMEENNLKSELKLYPNPAFDFVMIEVPDNNGQMHISVLDITGKVLFSQSTSDSKLIWNTQEVANGTYFVCIRLSSGEIQNKKLIVKH